MAQMLVRVDEKMNKALKRYYCANEGGVAMTDRELVETAMEVLIGVYDQWLSSEESINRDEQ